MESTCYLVVIRKVNVVVILSCLDLLARELQKNTKAISLLAGSGGCEAEGSCVTNSFGALHKTLGHCLLCLLCLLSPYQVGSVYTLERKAGRE